jgi:hypothetical protein
LFITNYDPRNIRNIVDSKENKLWKKSMVEEIESINTNEAWDPVGFLVGINPIGREWAFKKMLNEKCKVEKYKAHLLEKGYS